MDYGSERPSYQQDEDASSSAGSRYLTLRTEREVAVLPRRAQDEREHEFERIRRLTDSPSNFIWFVSNTLLSLFIELGRHMLPITVRANHHVLK